MVRDGVWRTTSVEVTPKVIRVKETVRGPSQGVQSLSKHIKGGIGKNNF